MKNKYKLYPVDRYILLSEWFYEDTAKLYETKEPDSYHSEDNLVMTINKNQCTRIIRKFGKDYYKIKV